MFNENYVVCIWSGEEWKIIDSSNEYEDARTLAREYGEEHYITTAVYNEKYDSYDIVYELEDLRD